MSACGGGPISTLRYRNHDPVWVVDDRRPIARPEERVNRDLTEDMEALLRRPVLNALEVPEPQPAANVNSLGEVPDSSWFENRIGARELDPSELARGPSRGELAGARPLIVHKADRPDPAPKLIVEDARGDRYLLKFDVPEAPELETGAEVVAQRLLWAAGYRVPENDVIEFARDELVIAQDAEYGDGRLTEVDLDRLLERAARTPDGRRWRALASRFLPGKPLGGYPMAGTRDDDPNDRVAHELRRDVRGQRLFFAWLGQTDVKEANTLDMWVEDPPGSGRGHVVHHLLDFGKSLGTWAHRGQHEHDGWAPHFDYGYASASLLTFGLWQRPWEGVRTPALRGVGRYGAERFDPDAYAPANPYLPFLRADRFDAFWAAKIIARFSPEHVAAAVRAARYSDPRAAQYLARAIVERRRRVLAQAFARVTPIAGVRVEDAAEGVELCATDLLLAHGLGSPHGTRYALRAYDHDGDPLPWRRELDAVEGGALCAAGLELPSEHDGYALVVLTVTRSRRALPELIVHVARRPSDGAARVIGLERR